MEKSGKTKYGCYQTLLYILVVWIAATRRLEKPHVYKVRIPSTGWRFLITGRDCSPKTEDKDIDHHIEKHSVYFVIVNNSRECNIWVAPGSQNYLFCDKKEKDKLCKVIKMEKVKLLRVCVLFGLWNAQHVGGGWNGSHRFEHYLYVIPEDDQMLLTCRTTATRFRVMRY